MATAPRNGLNPARKIGSGPDNRGLTPYPILTGYATGIGIGDPVKLDTDGTLIAATNGADAIGVFQGLKYTDSVGVVQWRQNWVATTAATEIEAYVDDNPRSTFMAKAEGPIPIASIGDIYAMNLTAPSTATGRSTATVKNLATRSGSADITAHATDITAVANISNNDTFTVKSSVGNDVKTVTLITNMTNAQLLAAINLSTGITATIAASTGFLVVTATDGGNVVLADGTGTPLADSLLLGAAGTIVGTVAANAGLVKVISIPDVTNKVLEVVLVNHSLRDDG